VASAETTSVGRRIGIIGAGPGGLCMAIKLKEAGYHDVVLWERATGVGGTWRNNSYPGCAVDVMSHLYSFSFRPKLDWYRPYDTQPALLAYLEEIVEDYGLAPHVRCGTGVTSAVWDDASATWLVATEDSATHRVDVLVSAVGMFNDPAFPAIPGWDTFAGTAFHSARWDHDHDLAGERVAVLGSAASAVQLVPEVAKVVGHLSVFQRSANWVLTKDDDPYTAEQLAAFRADPSIVRGLRAELWTTIDVVQTMKTRNVEALTRNLHKNLAQVDDPELRARLTPTHPYGCKRPLFSNDWFATFNRPNVELVTEPIAEITADAIVTADGTHHRVDTVIAATGFETARFASAIAVTGRSGLALADAWADGAQAYLGITTSGFPNLFMMYGPNTNNGVILHMLECQADYIVRQVGRMDREHLTWMDVRPEVMERYNRRIQADLDTIDVWQPGVCNNYIRAANGRIVTQWPHGMGTYREWTSMPDADAYEVGTRA
jgi:cation diffusion facilitator CzcD-associated flavoprotein CzcO